MLRSTLRAAALTALVVPGAGSAQEACLPPVALVAMPSSGARNVPERSDGPAYLLAGGLEARLAPDGPTSRELAAALGEMFRFEKVAARR